MQKIATILTASIILFLAVNTKYIWEVNISSWVVPIFTLSILIFYILLLLAVWHLYYIWKDGFKLRKVAAIALTISLLLSVYIRPRGLISFEDFESRNLLTACRQGAVNCLTTLKLKQDKHFKITCSCFGVEEETGSYTVSADSIFFTTATAAKKSFDVGIIVGDTTHSGKKELYLYSKGKYVYSLHITNDFL